MRTILITNSEELVDYADQWERLRAATRGNIYCSSILTRLWLDVFKESASPRMVLVEDKGEIVAIAPLTTSRFKVMGLSLNILSLAGWAPNCLGLVTNSVMCLPDRRDALRPMVDAIKRLKWSILFTENMEESGPIQMYMDEAQSTWHSLVQTPNKNHVLHVNESGEITKCFKSNGRRAINTMTKRIVEEGHEATCVKVPPSDIDRAVDLYSAQHIERWAEKGGSYFTNPLNRDFLNRAIRAAYEGGFGSIYEYIIDEDVAGQLFAFRDGDRSFFYRVGMNNAYSKYSPGRMVLYHGARMLHDEGARSFVLGGGDQRFKNDMGCAESNLIGLKATRGAASLIDQVISSRPVQAIDSRLGISNRFLKNISVEKTEAGA